MSTKIILAQAASTHKKKHKPGNGIPPTALPRLRVKTTRDTRSGPVIPDGTEGDRWRRGQKAVPLTHLPPSTSKYNTHRLGEVAPGLIRDWLRTTRTHWVDAWNTVADKTERQAVALWRQTS